MLEPETADVKRMKELFLGGIHAVGKVLTRRLLFRKHQPSPPKYPEVTFENSAFQIVS
jgi:hypothetical protein